MEKDYTLYPLNVSFNGSGITVDVDSDFVEYITKDIVDSLIYDAFCDEVDYVLTKYIGATGSTVHASEVEQELRERLCINIEYTINNFVGEYEYENCYQ